MNATQESAIAKLRAQQAKQEKDSPAQMVAEQLIDICSREPAAAEILLPDLDNPGMSVAEAEKEIKALADRKHSAARNRTCVCVSPKEAEGVLRKFYGLPPATDAPPSFVITPPALSINPLDFL